MRLFVLLKIQHFTFLHRKILQSQLCRKLHQIFLYFDSTATECLSFMYLLIMMFYVITVLWRGGVAQWQNVGLWPANFPCPALNLQLMGDH